MSCSRGTIRDNLRWGNENASDGEIEQACCLAQADEFIRQFTDQYETYMDQGGTNVSGDRSRGSALPGPAQKALRY